AAGRETHLAVLQVEAGAGKQAIIAGMVVVHVRDDHVLDRLRIDPQRLQTLPYGVGDGTAPQGSATLIEAGIDHYCPGAVAQHPDIVVERHRPVVRIAANEVLGCAAVMPGIGDGIGSVDMVAHRRLPPYLPVSISAKASRAMRK